MKTTLFNIFPDIFNTDITFDEVYEQYVKLLVDYLKKYGPTCTVRVDIGYYDFQNPSTDNPSYIETDIVQSEPNIHIAVTGDLISEVEEKIRLFVFEAPICLYNEISAEDKNILTSETCDYLNHLTSAFTNITIKDYPEERRFLAQQSDTILKVFDCPQGEVSF